MATEMSLGARLKKAHEDPDYPVSRSLVDEVAKMPADAFVWSALGSLALAFGLFNAGRKADAMFVGQLATPILALGLYKRLTQNPNEVPGAVHP